jgi:hypothetical protein
MAGIEKDHWLQNTRANDTGSIVDVSLDLIAIGFGAERRLLWPPAKISQLYYRSCVYVLLRILDATA